MKQIIIITISFLTIVLAGCGNNETISPPNADMLVSYGWKEYLTGNYEYAITKFQEALGKDPDSSEAYNGIGWSKAKLGKIDDSINNFKSAVSKDPSNVDASAGLAGVYLVNKDYERAIASAKSVLSLNPKYESPHDNIKISNIRILLAESYYFSGDYTSARQQIDLLGNYGKDLNASSPTYLTDLLLVIDSLAKKSF